MSELSRSVSVTLRATGVKACSADAAWVCCLNCDAPLELHQPDAEEPRRFVGTCDQCGRWYLLDWVPLSSEGHMLLLPNYEELQAAFLTGGS
jgi:hypothetical protein